MTALALALAYLGSLGFAGYFLWRRDRYRTDVADVARASVKRLNALEARAGIWDEAVRFIEAERVKRGMTRG